MGSSQSMQTSWDCRDPMPQPGQPQGHSRQAHTFIQQGRGIGSSRSASVTQRNSVSSRKKKNKKKVSRSSEMELAGSLHFVGFYISVRKPRPREAQELPLVAQPDGRTQSAPASAGIATLLRPSLHHNLHRHCHFILGKLCPHGGSCEFKVGMAPAGQGSC